MVEFIGVQEETRGKLKAVASGTLSNGDTVVVNSDGTVSAVAGSSVTQALGSETTIESSDNDNICGTFDSTNNKVIVFYRDQNNSNYGTAICGDVSGTSITFGTPITFRSANVDNMSAAFSPDRSSAVVAYTDQGAGADGYAHPVYVSNASTNTLTTGTRVEFNTVDSQENRIAYDGPDGSGGSYFLIHYRDDTNSAGELALINYPSGSHTLSLVNTTSVSGNTYYQDIAVGASYGSGVLSWRVQGSDNIYASVYSRSGTTVTLGSATQVNTDAVAEPNISYNAASDKYVIAYYLASAPQSGKAVVGTVSGTSITFGTAATFKSTTTRWPRPVYHSASGNVIIVYKDYNNSEYARAVITTISGTSISFGSEIDIVDGTINGHVWPIPETENNTIVFGYKNQSAANDGYVKVFRPAYSTTNITAENFIGISSTTVADTETATIDIIGTTNNAQSGLTAGQKYYVQNDGTLSTTADDPSVLAGTALSATKLVVKT